jgi:sortase A
MNPRGLVRKKRGRTGSLTLQGAFYFFLAAGVVALGYAGYVVAEARAYQAIQRSKFESASQSQSQSQSQSEERHPAIEGSAIGEVKIARLGLSVMFVQGDSPRILRRAVGHISKTALPGERGNVVLTAHRDSFFRPLRNIRQGDAITIETLGGEYQYQVDWTDVVSPSDVRVLEPSSENTLTLVTCFPFYYIGPAPKRFIVRAHQIGPLPTRPAIADIRLHH